MTDIIEEAFIFTMGYVLVNIEDENEVRDKLMRFSPDELLLNACKACKPVNVDIEVY